MPSPANKYRRAAWDTDGNEDGSRAESAEQEDEEVKSVNTGTTEVHKSQIRQKYDIYIKLVGMLVLPVVLLVVLLVVVYVDYGDAKQDRAGVSILAGYLERINAFTSRVQIERGTSAIFVGSGGSEAGKVLVERRLITDARSQDLLDYITLHQADLPTSFLLLAAGCRHFMVHEIPKLRGRVDQLQLVTAHFTAGIAKCHSLVSRFPDYTDEGQKAAAMVSMNILLHAKELAGQCRAVISGRLVREQMYPADFAYQSKALLRIQTGIQTFVSSVSPELRAGTEALLASDATKNWKAISDRVLALGDTTFDGPELSTEYFDVYSVWIKDLGDVIIEAIGIVQEVDANAGYTVWIVTILIVACLTPIVALWGFQSISVPFIRLGAIQRKLRSEKMKHTQHSEAVTRFVPFETLELLGCTEITEVEVGANQIRRMTIMFSYLHNFQLLASRSGADSIISLLNRWLDGVVPCISKNRGLVDKFMGDGLLAFFYKPEEAVISGKSMVEWLNEYNREAHIAGQATLEFGIGINSGDVCVGTIGSDTRMTTTAIGDEVNVAARIQSCTKMYGTRFLISESCKNFAQSNNYSFRYLGQTTVKGRIEPVDIHESLDCLPPADLALKKQTNITFQAALKDFTQGKRDEALTKFKEVIDMNPQDGAATWYIKTITKGPQEFVK